ncbi:MAG: hypothetical protein ACU837_09790 [Gammaproteobacteria bacterium]
MSVYVGINFDFSSPIVPSVLIKALLESGWGADEDGSISLLSREIHDSRDGDWKRIEEAAISYLLKWAMFSDRSDSILGFALTHQKTGIGGPIIIDEGRRSLAFIVQINIPRLFQHRNMIDFTKCFSIICPAINSIGLGIVRVEMFAE